MYTHSCEVLEESAIWSIEVHELGVWHAIDLEECVSLLTFYQFISGGGGSHPVKLEPTFKIPVYPVVVS